MKDAMRIAAGRSPASPEPKGEGNAGGAPAARLDPEAFAREFQQGFRALWCIAAGVLGDRGRAADVVQDAAIIALRKLDDFQPGTSFLAWMGRIVRFTAINERRKTVRHRTTPAEPATLERAGGAARGEEALISRAVDDHGEVVAGTEAFDDRVLRALGELTDQARACLLLRTVMDMPYKEISQALDIPEGTAMSHVHRARRSMRISLSGGSGGSGAGGDDE
jgi:RNA polymerase sigma-70 factor (ECF subfamily)